MNRLQISEVDPLTPEMFNELMEIKGETKFIECSIFMINLDLEVKNIFRFADLHMENKGNLTLELCDYTNLGHEKHQHFLSELENIRKIRQEQNIATCSIKFDFHINFQQTFLKI
uniref:Uncharacterized protein n=1 Tax=Panagrolaimus sp. ES5 TaxID=591445 RepID=A0AC34FVD9_9BILA